MNLLKLDCMQDMRKEEVANKSGDVSTSLTREQARAKTRPRKTLPNMGAEKQRPKGFIAEQERLYMQAMRYGNEFVELFLTKDISQRIYNKSINGTTRLYN